MTSPEPLSRPRMSAFSVAGEIFLTAGVVVLLFLAWQLWFNDLVVGAEQQNAAIQLEQSWPGGAQPTSSPEPTPTNAPTPEPTGTAVPPTTIPVASAPAADVPFATLIVPRLGKDYSRVIAEGVGPRVLNSNQIGIGHYSRTSMPGAIGNFAIAAHRSAYGGGFHNLNKLVVGDNIYVSTPDGWYRYVYRSTEYVRPTGVGVLAPVPQFTDAKPGDRIITLTTCNPLYSTAERLIAYGVFAEFTPRSAGAPDEIATVVRESGA